ncbi:MAG TPA: type II toxin-antitoxin system VapC family toxin [Anaerolineae bacterium]|nr:type II toxin-antitoxin system VapC family toxin [Anaerolineae bacterium]
MPRKPKEIVFDSWSVLAYFEDEPAGEKVADIIADARENGIPTKMTVVNIGEVWYILARRMSPAEADSSIAELRQLGIEFVDADWKLANEAARFKSKNKMSFADCFAAALAKENKADLVTGDQEFKQVEGEVRMLWV